MDFTDTFKEKKKNFVDLPDLYLSFIFNLLGNSFQLKTASESMLTANAQHDMVTFYQELGYILQISYDFDSYKTTAASLVDYTKKAARRPAQLKGVPSTEERHKLRVEHVKANADTVRAENEKKLKTGEGYNWRFPRDFLQAPMAAALGALNALGTVSSASYCSRYSLSARQYLFDAEPFFLEGNKLDGYDYYH